jgi:hypothetical protein
MRTVLGRNPRRRSWRRALGSAGIDAMIRADAAAGMRPHLAWAGGGFKVLVRDEDAAAAGDVHEPRSEPGIDGNPDNTSTIIS